jgi:hypothetical protein
MLPSPALDRHLALSDEDLDALLRDPEALGGDGPVEDEVPRRIFPVADMAGVKWMVNASLLSVPKGIMTRAEQGAGRVDRLSAEAV